MSLVEIRRYFIAMEAEVARTVLNSHGVEALVFDSGLNIADGGGAAFAVRLMVLDEDADQALAILAGD